MLVPGDLGDAAHCQAVVDRAVEEFGRIDVLVNNAAFQMTHETLEEITDEEWERTFDVNITAMFRLVQGRAAAHGPGRVDHQHQLDQLRHAPADAAAYATTKGAIANFTAGLAQMLGERGHPGQQRRARARSGRR